MLVVEPGRLADRIVGDLPALLRAEDVLVFNDTRVIPAQLDGARGEARIGATLHKRAAPRRWWAFVRNAKRVRIGDRIESASGVAAMAAASDEEGAAVLGFVGDTPVELTMERAGPVPRPPHISGTRLPESAARDEYQNTFAPEPGVESATT